MTCKVTDYNHHTGKETSYYVHTFYTLDDFTQEEQNNVIYIAVRAGWKICKECGWDNVPKEMIHHEDTCMLMACET